MCTFALTFRHLRVDVRHVRQWFMDGPISHGVVSLFGL